MGKETAPRSTDSMRRFRERERESDPEGFAERRRADMAEYRRGKRVGALVDVVRYTQACLELGQTPEQVAEALERQGVKPPKS